MSGKGKSWISWVYPFKLNRSHSRCSSASEASEYFSANDWTPDPDKKSVTWDETNFEKVRVFDGTGDKVNLVTVVPSRSTRKIELQRNIRYTKKSENQPLKTIERRKLSKEKSVPIISKRQVPEQEFVDELRRVDRLVERETYSISKYRVIQQRESRFDVSNLPSENEIKGGTLDSDPRLHPLLSKYDKLRTVSLELHHRNSLQFENLQQESPVKEIAEDICTGLLGVTSKGQNGRAGENRVELFVKPSNRVGKISEKSILRDGNIAGIVREDLIQGVQANRKDLQEDLADLKKLEEQFKDLHEELQSGEVKDDLRELHEFLLKDVQDDLFELQEGILDLSDLKNAGIMIVGVEPVQITTQLHQDSTPENNAPESNRHNGQDITPEDTTPESNRHNGQDITPEDTTSESYQETPSPQQTSQSKVTVPILVSFKDKNTGMFEEGTERKVSFRDTTGSGSLHQVLYYSGSEESLPPDVSPVITLPAGGFEDLSDIEIDFPDDDQTLSGVRPTHTKGQIEKDFVNVKGSTSADIMMELEKHFLDIGETMDFMLETGPRHNALPRRIRQDSLTDFRECGISGSVELLGSVQEETLPGLKETSPDQENILLEKTSSSKTQLVQNETCLGQTTCMGSTTIVSEDNFKPLSSISHTGDNHLHGENNNTIASKTNNRNGTTGYEGSHGNETSFSEMSGLEDQKNEEGGLLMRNYPTPDEKKKVLTILLGQRITTRVEEEEEKEEETGSFKTAEDTGSESAYSGNNSKIGAACPLDNMEVQFNKVGGKGADIAVLTSKGILNSTLTEDFNPFQLNTFRQIFDMYDKNGDNVINVEELRGILEILGYSPTPDEVKTILERFDQDNSGTIDFDEYLVLIQHWIEQDEEQIYEAFKVFDRDGDGFVSAQELKRALTQYGEQFTEDEANEFFNMMDTDGDGVINYEEFVEYLRSMQKYSTE